MNREYFLALEIYNKDEFILRRGHVDFSQSYRLVDSLVSAFKTAYPGSHHEYVRKGIINDDVCLFITQRKVPNVSKIILEHPSLKDIKIAFKGINSDGETDAIALDRPFNENKCKSLIPHYNNAPHQNINKTSR
jgi:hypothetical protein